METSRIRESGTKIFNTVTGADRINACRIVKYDQRYAKIDGVMVDIYTASAICAVYNGLNPANREKFISASIQKMAIVAYRLLK